MKQEKVTAIICAAGKGLRAGFDKNKLLVPLHGAPVLYYTLKKFDIPQIDEIIVTASEHDIKEITAIAAPFNAKVVTGGETRTESVKNALAAAQGDIVLIHDGARPFVAQQTVCDCIEAVKCHGSAVCAVKSHDTAVYVQGGKHERLDRNCVYLLHTPQGFYTHDIKRAYALAGDNVYTDDSAVYGEYIATPYFLEDSVQNRKLTYKSDFDFLPHPLQDTKRTGLGVDVHAFGEGDCVTLGGEKIACDKSLIAHSDGDVLCHAVMDACLSAAGLKDIGHYFPDTDAAYKDASSIAMLKEVVRIVGEAGLKLKSISVSIQAEKPKLAKHIDAIIKNLSAATDIPEGCIAVAAGTCEGLGFVGEGLGIVAYAAVTCDEV